MAGFLGLVAIFAQAIVHCNDAPGLLYISPGLPRRVASHDGPSKKGIASSWVYSRHPREGISLYSEGQRFVPGVGWKFSRRQELPWRGRWATWIVARETSIPRPRPEVKSSCLDIVRAPRQAQSENRKRNPREPRLAQREKKKKVLDAIRRVSDRSLRGGESPSVEIEASREPGRLGP
ncbi:hypothetical protein L249_6943, partial [Ophiocordyceps polyrhachis-furcata BCC 54312]